MGRCPCVRPYLVHVRLLPAFLLFPTALGAQTSVLFIGNSYTTENDLPNTFRELALSLGETVEVDLVAPGGFRLEQHFENQPTRDAIASRPWDVVVLQEQSQIPSVHPSNTALAVMFGSARLLVEMIKQNRECTLPVFYMTWGRENGDDQQCPSWPPVCTYEGMQQLLRERYVMMTEENFGRAAAVGAAWNRVRDERPDIDLYQADGSHPTFAGTYLAACVFFTTIFQTSCSGATFHGTLPPDIASVLQNIASTTMLDSEETWHLTASPGMTAQISGSDLVSPSILTLFHPGLGEHLWTCSNGDSATEQNPVFDLEPGTYQFTHAYTDLCGYTDTWSASLTVWHVSGIGIDELDTGGVSVSATAPGTVDVSGAPIAGTLTLFDVHGCTVLTGRLTGDTSRFSGPAGVLLWVIRAEDGTSFHGKVVVP